MGNRKPPERRQRRNTADLTVIRGGRSDVDPPDAPDGLLAATAEWWDGLWASDIATSWEPSDWPALVRLAEMYDERARALRGYREQRLVMGSQGQPVVNPMWKVAAELTREIRQLEDRFGLSPRARLNLGITSVQAQSSLEELMAAVVDVDEDDPFEVVGGEG